MSFSNIATFSFSGCCCILQVISYGIFWLYLLPYIYIFIYISIYISASHKTLKPISNKNQPCFQNLVLLNEMPTCDTLCFMKDIQQLNSSSLTQSDYDILVLFQIKMQST